MLLGAALACRLVTNRPTDRTISSIPILNGTVFVRDSTFESRVEDPPNIGFISKRDHDLEGTLQNDLLASSSDKLSPH